MKYLIKFNENEYPYQLRDLKSKNLVNDIQVIKDVFQSFEEDHNSLSSEYIILTSDRKVFQYIDGLEKLTQLEWREYYNNHVIKDVFKVKITFSANKSGLQLLIDDSLRYLDRIESEGFYCNCSNKGIASHIGTEYQSPSAITYYDIATKSDDFYKFLLLQNEKPKTYSFYFYFNRST